MNKTILIIEDEYSLADAIAETLKKENFNIYNSKLYKYNK